MIIFRYRYFIYVVLLSLISCKYSGSALYSDIVKSKIDSVNHLNSENNYTKSLSIIRSLDSLYPTDTEVKSKYIDLLRQTSIMQAKYEMSKLSDSIQTLDNEIVSKSKMLDIIRIDDDETSEYYYTPRSMSDNNQQLKNGFVIRIYSDAKLYITTKLVTNKKTDYQSVSIKGSNRILWRSNVIPYDDGLNYRYKANDLWVQSVTYTVDSLEKMNSVINENKCILQYLDNEKVNNVYVLSAIDKFAISNMLEIQSLLVQRYKCLINIQSYKKYLISVNKI